MISWDESGEVKAPYDLTSTEPIWINLPGGSYPIVVGYELLQHSFHFQPFLAGKKVFILTQVNIAEHYLPTLIKTCAHAGAQQIDHLILEQGEQFKTLQVADQIWSALLAAGHHRDTLFIALGGGVIGDLGGFSAACYMRGIKIIHCPTTLLGQIDAAIGGKTAINHPLAKNIIGAFHQPQAVFADLTTLTTLPAREFICGLAELIKYGIAVENAFLIGFSCTWRELLLVK